jgi:protein O-mannosyl-transferase
MRKSEDLCNLKKSVESPGRNKAIRQYVSCSVIAAVPLLTLVVYLPALRNGFVNLDDNIYVYSNLHIRFLDWNFFKWAFTDLSLGFWHPLTWISYAVDYALWGMNPMGFHLTAILLHTINTFLVVYLVIRLLEAANTPVNNEGTIELLELSHPQATSSGNPSENKEAFQTNGHDRVKTKYTNDSLNNVSLQMGEMENRLPSFLNYRGVLITAGITGLLFGLHPLHVESVTWVSERKDLLCAIFFLLSIMAYTNIASSPGKKSKQDKNSSIYISRMTDKWYILSLAFFAIALSAKTMAVSLPAVLLLLDWYPYRRIQSVRNFVSLVIEKLPFIAFSLLISIVSIAAQNTIGALGLMESLSLSTRVLVALRALMFYLWKMIVPLNLIPLYPYPENVNLLSIEYFSAMILMAGITAACLFVARKQRLWLSLWAYYVITLIPVLGIIQVGSHSMADRYTYLPSIGPFILLGLLSAWLSMKVSKSKNEVFLLKVVMVVTALVLLSSLAFITINQIGIWKSSLTLWNNVIEKTSPRLTHAYNNRGNAFFELGQFDRAIEDFNKEIVLNPSYGKTYYNRGVAYLKVGLFDNAIASFNKALEIDPTNTDTYVNRGISYAGIGQQDRAFEDFNKGIGFNLNHAAAYLNRGILYAAIGNKEFAISDFKKACSLGSENGCKALKTLEDITN